MRTIRRLYFYLLTFISLEVVLWSVITLARTVFDAASLNNIGDQIAGGLAFLIVGLPMFLFHWIFVQRDSARDTEERSSLLREIFLYGTYLATLIPIAQNVIALANRVLLGWMTIDNNFAFLGSEQTTADNLIAIIMMGVAFYYFHSVLKNEWAANIEGNNLPGTRRLFRYIWMLYSLVLLVFSMVFILEFIFLTPVGFGNPSRELLANGLSILVVAAPLWVYNWQIIQRSLTDREEYVSTFRLVVLYLLTLGGIITTLFSAGWVLATVLNNALSTSPMDFTGLFNKLSSTLALAIPMGAIWAYFGRAWKDTTDQTADPLRKAALKRFYFYVLALLGNISVFFAIQLLLGVVIDITTGESTGLASFSDSISSSLSMLIIGLPVWLLNWPIMQSEAASQDEAGDHARRSIIRKSYLYLVVFSLVVGLMASAGMLLYNLISTITVENPGNPFIDFLHDSKTLGVIVIWLVYHFLALRNDGKAAQAALADQHAAFTVGIIGSPNLIDVKSIRDNLQRTAPKIPLEEIDIEMVSKENLSRYNALVFSSGLLHTNPEFFHRVQNDFSGHRLVVTEPVKGWIWQGLIQRNRLDSAKETARLLRMMAEKQEIDTFRTSGGLTVAAYILAALFGTQILFMILSLIISVFIK
ncbi:hypothetical protein hrd7_16520 [Leptolinea sp. HRD-7]|nr:hypothetical protein hrd7_16520 [Leptolinea sp. HRD-7]